METKKKKKNKSFIPEEIILRLHFISSILENLNQLIDQPIFISYLGW